MFWCQLNVNLSHFGGPVLLCAIFGFFFLQLSFSFLSFLLIPPWNMYTMYLIFFLSFGFFLQLSFSILKFLLLLPVPPWNMFTSRSACFQIMVPVFNNCSCFVLYFFFFACFLFQNAGSDFQRCLFFLSTPLQLTMIAEFKNSGGFLSALWWGQRIAVLTFMDHWTAGTHLADSGMLRNSEVDWCDSESTLSIIYPSRETTLDWIAKQQLC